MSGKIRYDTLVLDLLSRYFSIICPIDTEDKSITTILQLFVPKQLEMKIRSLNLNYTKMTNYVFKRNGTPAK